MSPTYLSGYGARHQVLVIACRPKVPRAAGKTKSLETYVETKEKPVKDKLNQLLVRVMCEQRTQRMYANWGDHGRGKWIKDLVGHHNFLVCEARRNLRTDGGSGRIVWYSLANRSTQDRLVCPPNWDAVGPNSEGQREGARGSWDLEVQL